jgi:hypothetical protein
MKSDRLGCDTPRSRNLRPFHLDDLTGRLFLQAPVFRGRGRLVNGIEVGLDEGEIVLDHRRGGVAEGHLRA